MRVKRFHPSVRRGSESGRDRSVRPKAQRKGWEQCKNTLHYVCLILADVNRRKKSMIIVTLTRPIHNAHCTEIRELTTPENVLSFYAGYSTGAYNKVLRLTFAVLQNPTSLAAMGFEMSPIFSQSSVASASSRAAPEVALEPMQERTLQDEDALAACAWNLACHLVADRAASMIHFSGSYPGLLALAISPQPAEVSAGLAEAKRAYEAMVALEARMAGDRDLARLHAAIPFLSTLVVRESLVSLRQWKWSWVPPSVDGVLRCLFESWGHTAANERANNILRDHVRDRKNKAQCRTERYMLPHVEKVMGIYGRPEIVPNEQETGSQRRLPGASFEAMSGERSMDKKLFAEIQQKSPEWPTHSPERLHTIPAAFALLLHACEQDAWEEVGRAWLAVVMTPLSVVIRREDRSHWLVLKANEFGALMWPCQCSLVAGATVVRPGLEQTAKASWFQVTSLDAWRALPVEPRSPLALRYRCNQTANLSICVVQTAVERKIEEHAAHNAFKHMTEHWMSKLIRHLAISPPDGSAPPKTVLAKVDLLVRALLPDADEATVERLLASRLDSGHEPVVGNLEAINRVDSVLEPADKELCKKRIGARESLALQAIVTKAYFEEKGYAVPDAVAKLAAGAAETTSKPKAVAAPASVKKVVALQRATAKNFLPQAKGCILQPYPSKHSYQIYYPTAQPPRSATRTYVVKAGAHPTEAEALRMCLEWAWHHHTDVTGEVCPFKFK